MSVSSKCLAVRSSNRDVWTWKAALLTSTSSCPNSLTVRATALSQNFWLGDIAGDEQASSAFGFDLLLGEPRVVMFVQIGDGDIRAFAREENGHGPADAGIAAGDQRDLVLQFLRTEVKRCIVQRRRIERRFGSGFL